MSSCMLFLETSPDTVSGRNVQTWRSLARAHTHYIIFESAKSPLWSQLKVWPVTDKAAAAVHCFAVIINSFVFCFAKDIVFG